MSREVLGMIGYTFGDEQFFAADDNVTPQPLDYFIIRTFTGPTDGVLVVARRPLQMINLTFICHGYSYWSGTPDHLPRKKRSQARIVVEFPPQHLAEQAFEYESGLYELLPSANLSERTRLVFDVPDDAGDLKLSLTREPRCLLNWDEFKPRIDARARSSIDLSVESQLAAAFGQRDLSAMSLADAHRLLQGRFVAPDSASTTVEGVNRLILSPSEKASWIIGAIHDELPEEKEKYYPLWSASLDGPGRRSLRAIWTRTRGDNDIPTDPLPLEERTGESTTSAGAHILSLSPSAHWQIVGQTSMYGLPALRRLQSGPNGELRDAPNGSVVRPLSLVGYLAEVDSAPGTMDSGITIARPFDRAELHLTSVGATIDARWMGEPAALLPQKNLKSGRLWCGFDLERLEVTTWLGRDVQVTEVYKGFLYPLGVRASYAIVRERGIRLAGGAPISFLMKRRVILCSGNTRRYPGPYHPNAARDFPTKTVQMLTLITPDLVPPSRSPSPLRRKADDVFWPTYNASSGAKDVLFEWLTDDGVTVTGPLLFVGSVAAHDPGCVEALEAYYNGSGNTHSWADLAGSRKRYAESYTSGTKPAIDTSFNSYRWAMGVTHKDAADKYGMDGRMEGADQPPFFPVVRNATINIQSLDRLLGISHGIYNVAFDPVYLEEGFSTGGTNTREIYLSIKDPCPELVSSRNGIMTGALVKQDARFSAISRKIGLVGNSGASRAHAGITKPSGGFDPASFFKDVRLFGAIDLKDLIESVDFDDAPKLIESTEHGARLLAYETESAAISRINEAANHTFDAVYRKDGLRDRLSEFMLANLMPGITAGDLYTDLGSAANSLFASSGLNQYLLALQRAKTLDEVASQASIVRMAQPFIDRVHALLSDPVPDLLKQALVAIDSAKQVINGAAASYLGGLEAAILTFCCGWLDKALGGAVPNAIPLLLGEPTRLDDLSDVTRALMHADRGVFAEVFAIPLESAIYRTLITCGGLANRVSAVAIAGAARAEIGIVRAALSIADSYMVAFDPSIKNDIRQEHQQEHLRAEIEDEVRTLLTVHVDSNTSIESALSALLAIRTDFRDALGSALKATYSKIRALVPGNGSPGYEILVDALELNVAQRVVEPVEFMLDRLIAVLRKIASEEAAVVAQANRIWSDLLDALMTPLRGAELSDVFPNVCSEINHFVEAIAGDLKSAAASSGQRLNGIANQADLLAGKTTCPAPMSIALRGLAGEVRAITMQFASFTASVPPSIDICVSTEDGLALADRCRSLRSGCLGSFRRIADHLATLEATYANYVKAWLDDFRFVLSAICSLHTWQSLRDGPITAIIASLTTTEESGYATVIHQKCASLDAVNQYLAAILDAPIPAVSDLKSALINQVSGWLADLDGELSAGLLQIACLATDITGDIRSRTTVYLHELGKIQTAGEPAIELPHQAMISALSTVTNFANTEPKASILELMTGQAKSSFDDQIRSLTNELTSIHDLSSGDPATCMQAIQRIGAAVNQPGGMAILKAGQFIQKIVVANLAQNVTSAMQSVLSDILDQLETITALFFPTIIVTKYDWGVNLSSNKLFSIANDAKKDHLKLSTTIRCDLLNGRTTTDVHGCLQPFTLELLPGVSMASITFEAVNFDMSNGQAPHLSMKVRKFEIKENLRFISAIQKFLFGSTQGLYCKPIDDDGSPGIEAGYAFNVGLIQIGNIELINIAFNLGVKIYFDGRPARFFFDLASPETPFLIAYAPWGGVGYLRISTDGAGATALDVSLLFGGVAALQFGPLNASGRVVVGIGLKTVPGGWSIQAIFEAVGEGSIACFSMSVFMRFVLDQEPSGDLEGGATYGFSFRVGFVKIKYQIHASYKLSGGDSRRPAFAQRGSGVSSGGPDKLVDWSTYANTYSLDLLDH